jgi:glycosyltransferase involved in cell wall biosynthesis
MTRTCYVVGPAFNTGELIEDPIADLIGTQAALATEGWDMRVRITDDGSTDGYTGPRLDKFQAEHPFVKVHHHPKNMGNATVIKGNYTWAVNLAKPGDAIATLDLDGEHNPAALPRHLRMLGRQGYSAFIGTIIYPLDKPNWLDINMMRFFGALQAAKYRMDNPNFVQAGGWNVWLDIETLRHVILDVIGPWEDFFEDFFGELKRWGFHAVVAHLAALHHAKFDARYLECFGEAPNRDEGKLEKQAEAAMTNMKSVEMFMAGHSTNCPLIRQAD